ncbi:MAG: cheA 3 [Verrucomicrobiaceae bacterium]|nr:cheA 3 [Verrucomicrobiaceae bacterium]
MSFGEDEEILQDFLVEAGEIIEQLSEQLVDLERRPADRDLLNAIFRGFHTVKGGAGFLQLNSLVECCHITENLFDMLRNGQRSVTSGLMDVVLQALDAVNEMFDQVKAGEVPASASPELLARLEALVHGEEVVHAEVAQVEETASVAASSAVAANSGAANSDAGSQDITDAEFEQFLDALAPDVQAKPLAAVGAVAASSSGDEIDADEFEALLDQLHGKGKHSSAPQTSAPPPPAAPVANHTANTEEISEDEFDALLDQLHGKGKAPAPAVTPPVVAAPIAAVGDDAIRDDEFEALLDQLHGKGNAPGLAEAAAPAAKKAEAPAPATPPKAAIPVQAAPAKVAPPPAPVKTIEKAAADEDPQKGGNAAETTVRVDTQRLDDIMNMVGELVLVRNRLVRLGARSDDEALSKAVGNLDVVTADLQSAVMKTRMQPIKKVFGRFPRVVRDLARSLKKEVTLELLGEETDLDKNLVEALADPLVHLVRNAVDHGIESPEKREKSGKSRIGKIVLAAEQEGDHILLSITDDGAGMDAEVLRSKVVEKGLLDADAAARLNDTECYNLIFLPGFSTKTEISDVSGRGVGMDVVKTKISQLNGSIQIISKVGEGTRLIIKVPLTLAIMPTLMVMLGQQTFALPLASVNEIFHMDLRRVNVVDGREMITVREKAIPLFFLKNWLVKNSYGEPRPQEAHVVIVSVGIQRVGFVVDQLIGQEEVVIKPLGKMLQGTPGMAGATITGDGRIALILDVPSMLKRYAR